MEEMNHFKSDVLRNIIGDNFHGAVGVDFKHMLEVDHFGRVYQKSV